MTKAAFQKSRAKSKEIPCAKQLFKKAAPKHRI